MNQVNGKTIMYNIKQKYRNSERNYTVKKAAETSKVQLQWTVK